MQPTLLILAAGMGSRYGGLKQADSMGPNGEAIIEYAIHDAQKAGFGKIVIVIRKDIEADFKEKFEPKFPKNIPIHYAFQEKTAELEYLDVKPERQKPLGTGHAMLVAESLIQEPFLVINADDFYGYEAFELMADFLKNDCSTEKCSMVGYFLKNTLSENGTVSRGVCEVNAKGNLTQVTERHHIERNMEVNIQYQVDGNTYLLPNETVVCMNFWGFHPSVFALTRQLFRVFVEKNFDNPKSEFYIPLVANHLIESKMAELKVLTSDSQWFGVTYQEDKATVQNALKALEKEYPILQTV